MLWAPYMLAVASSLMFSARGEVLSDKPLNGGLRKHKLSQAQRIIL